MNLKNWTTLVGRPVSPVTLPRSLGFPFICFSPFFLGWRFIFYVFSTVSRVMRNQKNKKIKTIGCLLATIIVELVLIR